MAARPSGPSLPDDELNWRFSRSSGPGGQHVNTSDTRASVSFDVAASAALTEQQRERALDRLGPRLRGGVVTVSASDTRSQARNRELARERLEELVRGACAPPPKSRRATRPSRGARRRRLDDKRRRSELKRSRSRRSDD